jgi:hypothetical protein
MDSLENGVVPEAEMQYGVNPTNFDFSSIAGQFQLMHEGKSR